MSQPQLDQREISELADAARAAAQAGGRELVRWTGKFTSREKGPSDFVTDADLASQEAIRSLLADRCPEHAFVGEESPDAAKEAAGSGLCWVVDPLDGTTNYLHGFPSYAVSVAVVRDGKPLAGAILDPLREEMYWAAQGQGAWLGEERIATSDAGKLADALLAISLPASVTADCADLADFSRLAPHCQAVRRIGSAALNLAYVAAGKLDAYWARNVHAWDVAAGVLLVAEAGGKVTGDHGQPLDIWEAPCVASCGGQLHEQLLNKVAGDA